MPSPFVRRMMAEDHVARPAATPDLGDPVAADKHLARRSLPRTVCLRALVTRDCPLGHRWVEDALGWLPYGENHGMED